MSPTDEQEGRYRLRLYVAGEGPTSLEAQNNLRDLCEEHLAERYEIEVVDFLTHPDRALDDGVLVTPTLLKLAPGIPVTVVGTLSQADRVLRALGLHARRP